MCGSKPMLVGVHVALSRINGPFKNSFFSFDPRVGFGGGVSLCKPAGAFASHLTNACPFPAPPAKHGLCKPHQPQVAFEARFNYKWPLLALSGRPRRGNGCGEGGGWGGGGLC